MKHHIRQVISGKAHKPSFPFQATYMELMVFLPGEREAGTQTLQGSYVVGIRKTFLRSMVVGLKINKSFLYSAGVYNMWRCPPTISWHQLRCSFTLKIIQAAYHYYNPPPPFPF
jgi:hypothetical protein